MDNQRNMILAIVLSALVLFGWSALTDRFLPTANPPATVVEGGETKPVPAPAGTAPTTATAIRDRTLVLGETPRVKIETPRLLGSINLRGARIDDLVLPNYRETIEKNSPAIRLLSPDGARDSYFAGFGWSGDGVNLPGPDTVWRADGAVLTPDKPVTLTWANGQGQTFAIKIAVDRSFMFTVTQTVANSSAGAIGLRPYGYAARTSKPADPDSWTVHIGPMGVFDRVANYNVNYEDLAEAGSQGQRFSSTGGWLGFTDKFWLAALVPPQNAKVDAGFREGNGSYQADFALPATIVAPGKASSVTSHLFAGAKEVGLLDDYEDELGIAQFDKSVDWGWFYWFAKPIFYLLHWLFLNAGNFGVAIMLLTVIIRGLMFPIAQKQFASMAGMRAVQPKMKVLQDRYKDDKQKLQQEMLKLYKDEKVNPLAGCLPILIQIPIFYALYKVLLLSVEMRHQPFVLWIKDLSAPDPLTPLNLFGLLNFTPPQFIALGILPILLGISMWLQFKLNPPATDPIQQQVFSIMPWVFMFIMIPFAAGLQLYWITNNILSIAQQKWLYSKHPGLKEPLKT